MSQNSKLGANTILSKLVAFTVAVYMLVGNFAVAGMGLGQVIAEDEKLPQLTMNYEATKYVVYDSEAGKGAAVKTKLQLGEDITSQEEFKAVKNVNMEIIAPRLNNKNPERVAIVSNTANLSNGRADVNVNQNYDSNSGLLKLSYKNETGYAEYKENAMDEFEIVYIYSADALMENSNKIEATSQVRAKVEFNKSNKSIERAQTYSFALSEKRGEVAEVATTSTEVYKGYLYSNENNKTSYKTNYTETQMLDVMNSEIVDKVVLTQEASKFLQNNNEIDANVVIKSTAIPSNSFYKMFGIDGYVDVFVNNEKYATIRYNDDKDRKYVVEYVTGEQKETEGKVEYPANTKSVYFVTGNPIHEGTLQMTTEKSILASQSIKASTMNAIKENNIVVATKGETAVATAKEVKTIALQEPTTQMSLELSGAGLSTLTSNKVTATIKLNDTNSSCKLLQAGTLTMTLPANLTSAKITNAKLLYGNGLSASGATIKDGKVVVTLTGKQTKYNTENISGGVNLVLDLELDIKNTVATHTETLTASFAGAKATTDVNVVSKPGLLMINNVTTNQGVELTSMDNADRDITLKMNKKGQTVSQTVSFVNNYDNDLSNVSVVGMIGYKDAETSANFDMSLAEAIKVSGVEADVYYSNSYTNSQWTKNYNKGAKAYKIVVKGNMKKQSSFAVTTKMNVPDGLTYNKVSYLNVTANYAYGTAPLTQTSTMKLATETKQEVNALSVSGTNQKKLSVSNTNNLKVTTLVTEGDNAIDDSNKIYEGQILRYTVQVQNTGNTAINNLQFTSQIENAVYYELRNNGVVRTVDANDQEHTGTDYMKAAQNDTTRKSAVFSLNKGETKTFEYQVVVNNDAQSVKSTVALVNTQSNTTLYTKTMTNGVKQARLQTELKYAFNNESEVYSNSQMNVVMKYTTFESALNNIQTTITLPEGIELEEYQTYGVDTNVEVNAEDNGKITCNIDSIKANSEMQIVFVCNTKKLNADLTAETAKISAVTKVGGETYTSNNLLKEIKQSESDIKMNIHKNFTDDQVFTENKDNLEYTVTLKNDGSMNLENVNVMVGLDAGLTVNKLLLNGKEQKVEDNTGIDTEVSLPSGQEATVQAILGLNVANAQKEDKLDITTEVYTGYTENLTSTSAVNIKKASSANSVVENTDGHSMLENTTGSKTTGENTTSEGTTGTEAGTTGENAQTGATTAATHKITGVAWLDSNKDGKRDNGEELLKDITVTLIDAKTGSVAKNSEGNAVTATTDDKGAYTFENVAPGKYIVMFDFDMTQYTATTYQKSGVASTINSDAIISRVTMDGNQKLAGITNNIEVKDKDITNIDIGLIKNAVFDLSLDKQIASIVVTNAKGTKTTEYNNKNFAKVDLVAKYMNNTNVAITYKFVIKNNGEVTGYVDRLVDNLPSGLEFNSGLNKDWYKGSDGNLYTTSLGGVAIKPGETKEVQLVLTKRTTENTTGTFTNNAELSRVSNIEAVAEQTTDNNKSSADLVISIKTGSAIMYAGITLGSIAIIAAGAYIIKKKVLNKGI